MNMYMHVWALDSDQPPEKRAVEPPGLAQQWEHTPASAADQSTASCPRPTATAMSRSPPARPKERPNSPSAHIPYWWTSRGGCSNLTFLEHLLWQEDFLAGVEGGSGVKNICMVTDSWSLIHGGNQGCPYNLTGGWPVFHQSFIHQLMATGGTQFHSECWVESYSSPTAYHFLKSTTCMTTWENYNFHFSFLGDNKVQGKQNELFTVSKAFWYSIISNISIITILIFTLRHVPNRNCITIKGKNLNTTKIQGMLHFSVFAFSMY